MVSFWSLCCLIGMDFATFHILRHVLSRYFPLSLALAWGIALAQLLILALVLLAGKSIFRGRSFLREDKLLASSIVSSLLVPSCATWAVVFMPRTGADLLHRWGHLDLFICSHLITLTSALVWHQLFLSGEDEKGSSASVWRLLALLRPYSWRFLLVAVFLVLSSWGEMALPAYTGRMADWIHNKEDPSIFWTTIITLALITISSAVTEFVCDCIFNVTMSLVHTQSQGKLLFSILKQDITFFDTVPAGDITSRVTSDITAMSEALSHTLSLLMWYAMRLAFLFIYMAGLSPKLTLFTVLCLLIITIVPRLSGTYSQNLAVKIQGSLCEVNQVAMETFSNMKTVRSFANEEGECQRYEGKLDATYQLNKTEALAYGWTLVANSFSGLALKVGILYFGGRLVTNEEVSGGELVSFVLYELQFASAVEVSVVTQVPVLSSRTIKDNISYGLGETSLESVQEAAKASDAHDFILQRPQGYQTGAGQRGELLSGGQKQRVALARALLRDPKVLILDDATSSLDTDTELKIQETLYSNARRQTVLLISHRMNVIEKADHILVLEGGQIIESGNHEQLLAERGSYWRLRNRQQSSFQRGEEQQMM
ncbi:hypothetical protein GDO81_026552 [Engystomops pustulosus]|uniref:Transporter associated with antigen processing 1 n=1 Tax=Engystomops pustulosus TaxID=76066 RepID=A0AAV6ZGE8_ENGPU|nr:hypothetical protein GDO81_026552 [Engystomops pustulosus]